MTIETIADYIAEFFHAREVHVNDIHNNSTKITNILMKRNMK